MPYQGCRWQRVHRLHVLLRAHHPGPPPPEGGGGRPRPGRPRRLPDPPFGEVGGAGRAPGVHHPLRRLGDLRQGRLRCHQLGAQSGPRPHRSRQGHRGLWVLPRLARLVRTHSHRRCRCRARPRPQLPVQRPGGTEASVAAENKGQVAAIILTPFRHDFFFDQEMPAPGFLEGVRALCDQEGIVLVLDDVRAGFRLNLGGSWEPYGVRPDLTLLLQGHRQRLPTGRWPGPRGAAAGGREGLLQRHVLGSRGAHGGSHRHYHHSARGGRHRADAGHGAALPRRPGPAGPLAGPEPSRSRARPPSRS